MTIKRRIRRLWRHWTPPPIRPDDTTRSNVFIVPNMDTPIPAEEAAGFERIIVIPDNGRSRRN